MESRKHLLIVFSFLENKFPHFQFRKIPVVMRLTGQIPDQICSWHGGVDLVAAHQKRIWPFLSVKAKVC